MKKILSIFILTISPLSLVFAQAAWDLKYLPLDSLNTSFLEREIRLDFKAHAKDNITQQASFYDVRSLLFTKDTIQLFINQQSFRFLEDWRIYDDWGLLKEQFLIYTEDKYHLGHIKIKEMTLKSINKNEIVVKCKLYFYSSRGVLRKTEQQEISVNKLLVKGFLVSSVD